MDSEDVDYCALYTHTYEFSWDVVGTAAVIHQMMPSLFPHAWGQVVSLSGFGGACFEAAAPSDRRPRGDSFVACGWFARS